MSSVLLSSSSACGSKKVQKAPAALAETLATPFHFALRRSPSRALLSRLQAHILLSEHQAGDGTRAVRETGHELPLFLVSVHGRYTDAAALVLPLEASYLGFSALSAAPGGKLCPFLHLHSGLQERLPKHPAGHHGECGRRSAVSIATAAAPKPERMPCPSHRQSDMFYEALPPPPALLPDEHESE